jgi:hypothetical protein
MDQEGLQQSTIPGLEHVASAYPPTVRIICDNPIYGAEDRSAEEVNVVGRIRWFARGV